MNAFFYYFYNMMGHMIGLIWNIVVSIKDAVVGIFNFKYYIDLFKTYMGELSAFGWVAAIVVHIIMIAIFVLIFYLLYRLLRFIFRFKIPVAKYEKLKDEVVELKREIMKANYEKDKLLAMRISELGIEVDKNLIQSDLDKQFEEEFAKEEQKEKENIEKTESVTDAETAVTEEVSEEEAINAEQKRKNEIFNFSGERRFPRLTAVDQVYFAAGYEAPSYRKDYNLEELCILFRNFAAGKLHLYYELELIKQVFASFGAAKMLILQGISGTGKTSLPYALGQFIENPSLICSVQPSWRDRTELFGYYNDFTKKYTETEFLKTMYEGHFQDDIKFVILDEMNIARVEYYFAEMLSILELPRPEERYISVVSNSADGDPYKMIDGKVWIPSNVFYVGTINNDDSTFAVADKVYDRAIPIDLDDKAAPFETPDTPSMRVSFSHLQNLYEEAKAANPISEEMLAELEKLDNYLIKHFRLTFGNRILRQIKDFVPCYIACGGTELGGIDFMFAKKILRKFESLGLGFIRDEIDGLILYLEKTFGQDGMKISVDYLMRLKKMSGS